MADDHCRGIKEHWDLLASLGCCVCGRPAQIHHVHGGSVREFVHKGLGQKTDDWLVIPLCERHHTGNRGIDVIGVVAWEGMYGSQRAHLDDVCVAVRFNVWHKAGIAREVEC